MIRRQAKVTVSGDTYDSIPCRDNRHYVFIVDMSTLPHFRIFDDFLTRSTCGLSPSALRIMVAVRRRMNADPEPSAAASNMPVVAPAPSERPTLSQRTPVPQFPSETARRFDLIAQRSTPERLLVEEPVLHADSTDNVFGLSARDASHVAGASS